MAHGVLQDLCLYKGRRDVPQNPNRVDKSFPHILTPTSQTILTIRHAWPLGNTSPSLPQIAQKLRYIVDTPLPLQRNLRLGEKPRTSRKVSFTALRFDRRPRLNLASTSIVREDTQQEFWPETKSLPPMGMPP